MKASGVKPITYMKTHSAELVATVNQTGSPIVITQNGEARAVVLDVKSYERMQDALILLKLIAQSDGDFRKGRTRKHEEVAGELEKRLSD